MVIVTRTEIGTTNVRTKVPQVKPTWKRVVLADEVATCLFVRPLEKIVVGVRRSY